jgi:chitinase
MGQRCGGAPRASLLHVAFALLLPLSRAAAIPLTGYLCASCPSAPAPNSLVANIHASYGTVIFAFAGWDDSGNVVNQWDEPTKNFTLTRATVAALQAQGRAVLLSLGGGAGNVLPGPPAAGWAAALARNLLGVSVALGLDGFDLDVENFGGSALEGMAGLRAVVAGLRAAPGGGKLRLTCAPQMTDVFPDYPSFTPGFNRYAPLLEAGTLPLLDAVMPQMYNSWAQVETLAYAETYAGELVKGFAVAGAGPAPLNVTIPPEKLWLGFPASRAAAGSGFISPPDVAAAVKAWAAAGLRIAGLMTWSIGEGRALAAAPAAPAPAAHLTTPPPLPPLRSSNRDDATGWDQQNGWLFAAACA